MYNVYTTGRKNKHKLEVYIDTILRVLKTGISWNSINGYVKGDTIRKKFIKWSKMNIFNKIYLKLKDNYLKNNSIKNLYIG